MCKRLICAASAVLFSAVPASAAFIANSVSQYSLTQGQDGWFYGYYDRTADANKTYQVGDFRPFTNTRDGAVWFVDEGRFFTAMDSRQAHVNGPVSTREDVEHWAIRRFIAPEGGEVTIHVEGREDASIGGDGVSAKVFINGQELLSERIAMDDTAGFSENLTATIQAGATIDFVLTPGVSDHFDCPLFISTLTLIPEPSSMGLLGIGTALLLRRRR
jgi:hypothetical protein